MHSRFHESNMMNPSVSQHLTQKMGAMANGLGICACGEVVRTKESLTTYLLGPSGVEESDGGAASFCCLSLLAAATETSFESWREGG